MRRFWTMVAHYHGQAWSAAELAQALGVSRSTVSRHLDALTDALVIRQLQPWFANLGKHARCARPRSTSAAAAVAHRLLGIAGRDDLLGHPKVGAG